MTKQEARKKLYSILHDDWLSWTPDSVDVLQMAIDALDDVPDRNVGDMISRQAAIDIFDDYNVSVENGELEAYSRDRKRLCNLPSAQPERRIGKWIIRTDDRTEWYRVACSECGEDVTATIPLIGSFPFYKALWDYCPECGADMRG